MKRTLLILAGIVLAASCSTGATVDAGPTPSPSTTTTSTSTTTTVAPTTTEAPTTAAPTTVTTEGPSQSAPGKRCQSADPALVAAIQAGANTHGQMTLTNVYVVKSNDFAKVWFVGAMLESMQAPAVWATNSLTGDGSIFSADSVSAEFSSWGRGQPGLLDDGNQLAQSCAMAGAPVG